MESGQVPIFDFPVLSDERVYAGRPLAEAGPGQRVVSDEKVWEFLDDWNRGEELGSVSIEEVPTTRPGRIRFTATFDFGDNDPVVVSGFVPGNGSWAGRGRGAANGGGQQGAIDIEGRNPKRWG